MSGWKGCELGRTVRWDDAYAKRGSTMRTLGLDRKRIGDLKSEQRVSILTYEEGERTRAHL